ncbi:MAG: formate dehydrogenase accessory sulfurtransferase FdhD [Actinomycetes bacterium]
MPNPGSSERVKARRVGPAPRDTIETLAVEAPLQIRLEHTGKPITQLVTMRTPGADLDLAAGWLLGEGVVHEPEDVVSIRPCTDDTLTAEERGNVVTVALRDAAAVRAGHIKRTTDVSSACGVCGSATLHSLHERGLTPVAADVTIDADLVVRLPDLMRDRQRVFTRTGGLHAAGVFSLDGAAHWVREDVGRHNAVDKVLGAAFISEQTPLSRHALVVTSRASFEILQKAVAAGVPVVVAISAPSTLAVDVAEQFGITLVGFVREGRATVYSHGGRVTERAVSERPGDPHRASS